MPWTPAQMKSIRARAHGWKGPGAFENVSARKATVMESEGLKTAHAPKSLDGAMSHLKKHHK